jgi:hypothetical protein
MVVKRHLTVSQKNLVMISLVNDVALSVCTQQISTLCDTQCTYRTPASTPLTAPLLIHSWAVSHPVGQGPSSCASSRVVVYAQYFGLAAVYVSQSERVHNTKSVDIVCNVFPIFFAKLTFENK